jgi:hypothetical protein
MESISTAVIYIFDMNFAQRNFKKIADIEVFFKDQNIVEYNQFFKNPLVFYLVPTKYFS